MSEQIIEDQPVWIMHEWIVETKYPDGSTNRVKCEDYADAWKTYSLTLTRELEGEYPGAPTIKVISEITTETVLHECDCQVAIESRRPQDDNE